MKLKLAVLILVSAVVLFFVMALMKPAVTVAERTIVVPAGQQKVFAVFSELQWMNDRPVTHYPAIDSVIRFTWIHDATQRPVQATVRMNSNADSVSLVYTNTIELPVHMRLMADKVTEKTLSQMDESLRKAVALVK
jgi:hypothetical protein